MVIWFEVDGDEEVVVRDWGGGKDVGVDWVFVFFVEKWVVVFYVDDVLFEVVVNWWIVCWNGVFLFDWCDIVEWVLDEVFIVVFVVYVKVFVVDVYFGI